ncbi:hypothetical protein [Haladaptatus caseinilyticus]|uniref:hypothetical protein n=1 Tax=Haladaptatus caseinilyticus TaxID=2993314 RepID=UPI00224B1D73|nr:hypothetical protein [Haladaptatus caseinilyticus]
MQTFTETLEIVVLGDNVRIELVDGTIYEGPASPIDYMPDERFRLEIEPGHEQIRRCAVSAECIDGEWSVPEVRHYSFGDDDWTLAGEANDIEITR